MKVLQDNNLQEVTQIVSSLNLPKFRAKQLFLGMQNGNAISQISTLPKSTITQLIDIYADLPVKILQEFKSKKDETIKFLFELWDGNIIEGVLMKYKYGYTQCVSTQVGCRMGCAFCASTLGGLVRNLTAGEILGQVLAVNKYLGGTAEKRQITNIVLMGSGEPLDNYDNTVKFLRLVSSTDSLNISPRNISLSTCGIVKNIYRLAEEGLPINLTISLHNPYDEQRKMIMPISKSNSIEDILKASKHYFNITGRRYIFEYCLIRNKTLTVECANKLVEILRGHPCHVNLIRLNAVKENKLEAPTDKEAYEFLALLEKGNISATVRRQVGVDIDGACGQLRAKFIEKTVK